MLQPHVRMPRLKETGLTTLLVVAVGKKKEGKNGWRCGEKAVI
jgi:hypothetical protein